MENQNKVQKIVRTREEKDALILQWKQSGVTRKKFCEDQGLNYCTFGSWCEPKKKKLVSTSGFKEIKIQSHPSTFAQVHLPGGVKIDFYQSVPAEYFQSLLK